MGLDMYLDKHIYIGANFEHNSITGSIDLQRQGKQLPIVTKRVKYIVEEGAYWRKANQIHRWFVENVQDGEDDCREYYVSREQLQELVNFCKQVLDAHKNNTGEILAQELLPTQAGFFYGNTDYDDYYFQQLQDTIDQVEPLIQEEYGDFYYTSSW